VLGFDEPAIATGEHAVEFYERDELLALSVSSFLGAGLIRGEAALVVATPEHRLAFEDVLLAAGVDLRSAAAEGRYVALDAAEVLATFMSGASAEPRRFRREVGQQVARLTEDRRPLRIYGEMVAILWEAGNVTGAIELEELWNSLGADASFSLLCAYRSSTMQGLDQEHELVCGAHHRTIAEPAPVGRSVHDAWRYFEPTPSAPRAARQFVAQTLRSWGIEGLIHTAEIVVSELATNATHHAESRFTVTLSLRPGGQVRLAVADNAAEEPWIRQARGDDVGGRGMYLVNALASTWGTDVVDGSKTVWADLDLA
jgi:anti-sigma regulatory factor (Ser/Thr protein kinase)